MKFICSTLRRTTNYPLPPRTSSLIPGKFLMVSLSMTWGWNFFQEVMNLTGVFRMGKKPLVDSKIWGAGCHMWEWQTLWTMRPRGFKVDSVGVVGLKFVTGKDETTHYGKSTKVENGTLAEEADWGLRLASFHGVRETNLISFVGYRSVSSNVWASHEQRPQPHRRSLVSEKWKYSALMRRWVTQLTWSFFFNPKCLRFFTIAHSLPFWMSAPLQFKAQKLRTWWVTSTGTWWVTLKICSMNSRK